MVMIVQNNFFFSINISKSRGSFDRFAMKTFFFPLVEQKIRLLSKQFQSF